MKMDDELEEIKKRKLLELQKQQEMASIQEQQRQQMELERDALLRQITTPEARERLARLKMAHPDIAESVENQLLALAQSGRLDRVIDDETRYLFYLFLY
jgi:programmed cell death protein 5